MLRFADKLQLRQNGYKTFFLQITSSSNPLTATCKFHTDQNNQMSSNVLRKRKFVPQTPKQDPVSGLPEKARVVVCGGGIIGASVAYHLAKMGWGKDTVLIEQDKVGGGSPWLASGFAGRFEPTYTEVKLTQYSIALIKELTEQGLPTGWKQVGSLNLARVYDRMTYYKRMKSMGVASGIACKVLTPEECKEMCPLLEVSDLIGGFWIPDDGVCNPTLLCQSFVQEAKRMGVTVVEHIGLKKIRTSDGKVSRVDTTSGDIVCDFFVNCTGFWAREVGTLSTPVVKVPLKAVEHHFLHTKPIAGLDPMTPFVRDFDGGIYFREMDGRILAGE